MIQTKNMTQPSLSLVSKERTTELLNHLERFHIEESLKKLDGGATTRFSESVKFDVYFQGKRYAPKRVAGLALEILTGKSFGPKSFKGGAESACFRALKRCGFTIIGKEDTTERSLTADLSELLALQREYESSNTPQMERRGILIRKIIPGHIRAHIEKLEPVFSLAGFSFGIEGSDGIGRKVESPWVRVFDELMSPSATEGWYIVLHFSRNGRDMFLTLGCGATTFHQGNLVNIDPEQLRLRVEWARDIAASEGFSSSSFQDRIDLMGNALSDQFERATAFAKLYRVDVLNEDDLWTDMQVLCGLLMRLYERERLGQAPLTDQPEVKGGLEAIEEAVSGGRRRGLGQGRNISAVERRAIENQAMTLAQARLEAEGFTEIQDVSLYESYDFATWREGTQWKVEVKGTTSNSVDVFLMTAAELAMHRKHAGQTVLVLVYGIELVRKEEGVLARGGRVELHIPWIVDEWLFEPTAFRATRGRALISDPRLG